MSVCETETVKSIFPAELGTRDAFIAGKAGVYTGFIPRCHSYLNNLEFADETGFRLRKPVSREAGTAQKGSGAVRREGYISGL